MNLVDLAISTDALATARCIADDLDMSEDALFDHVLETCAREDWGHGDGERFEAWIRALIEGSEAS